MNVVLCPRSIIVGTLASCGSPMPLPSSAPSLTAEADLIREWIDDGALQD